MKKSTIFLSVVLAVTLSFSYAIAEESSSMRINKQNTGCDHRPFKPGLVSTNVMEATNGQGGDVIETVGESSEGGLKHAKRLHVNPDGWTYVYQWVDVNGDGGDCVWIEQKPPFMITDMQELLLPGESLSQTMVSEVDQEYWDTVMTEGTYMVHKVE